MKSPQRAEKGKQKRVLSWVVVFVGLGVVGAQEAKSSGPFDALRTGAEVLVPNRTPVPPFLAAVVDPVFGTRIMRITDPAQLPNVSRIRHYYSKTNPFNADETLAYFAASDGSSVLYDTQHWRPVRTLRLRNSDPEIQWDPLDPNILYHLDLVPGSIDVRGLYRYDFRTNRHTLLRDFVEYDRVRGKLEGNLDKTGRYYAMVGKKDRLFEAFVYDLRQDLVGRKIQIKEMMVSDWISVSPGGQYVVMMGKDRSRIYDLEMNLLHELPSGSFGHADLCLRADGSEVMVYDGADHQLDDNRNLNVAELRTGRVSRLIRIGWRTTPHISCRNIDLPGWVLVSTQGPDRKYPQRDFEIFWVKLDGSSEVRRLAHHHSLREKGGYFAEQHAVSNRSGTKVVFASNWAGEGPIASYLVELPAPRGLR